MFIFMSGQKYNLDFLDFQIDLSCIISIFAFLFYLKNGGSQKGSENPEVSGLIKYLWLLCSFFSAKPHIHGGDRKACGAAISPTTPLAHVTEAPKRMLATGNRIIIHQPRCSGTTCETCYLSGRIYLGTLSDQFAPNTNTIFMGQEKER